MRLASYILATTAGTRSASSRTHAMKPASSLVPLYSALAVLFAPHPAFAALTNADAGVGKMFQAGQPRPHAQAKRTAVAAQPVLSEVQALHALETEISRKVGLQIKEA